MSTTPNNNLESDGGQSGGRRGSGGRGCGGRGGGDRGGGCGDRRGGGGDRVGGSRGVGDRGGGGRGSGGRGVGDRGGGGRGGGDRGGGGRGGGDRGGGGRGGGNCLYRPLPYGQRANNQIRGMLKKHPEFVAPSLALLVGLIEGAGAKSEERPDSADLAALRHNIYDGQDEDFVVLGRLMRMNVALLPELSRKIESWTRKVTKSSSSQRGEAVSPLCPQTEAGDEAAAEEAAEEASDTEAPPEEAGTNAALAADT